MLPRKANMIEISQSNKVVCFVSVARFDEFSGGVDRVACSLIRYFKERGFRVISYYWQQNIGKLDYNLIDKSYQFPKESPYSEQNIEKFVEIIQNESIKLIFDVSFLGIIHKICYMAKNKCSIKSILLYQGDPFAYTKSLKDYRQEVLFNQKSLCAYIIRFIDGMLKYPFSWIQRYYSTIQFHKQNLLYSDVYVLLSESYVRQVSKLLRLKSESSICFVPNAVPPFTPHKKKRQIIFIGRMDWQKRIDRLLRIWKRAAPKLPEWELIIVGDGPYKDRFVCYANDLHLVRYQFIGACPAQAYIEESSILCLTSSYEGFGLTLVEAQSCGCVPIAFDSYAAIRDIIDDGISGLLIPPFKEDKYANAIVDLCNNDVCREKLARNCIIASQKFTPEKIEKKWDVILKSLSING